MNILAIDLGTQSIRAALVSKEGKILEVSQLEQEVESPKIGWAQQKPEIWWKLTKQVIKNVINTSNININSIKGISTRGQMHGPVGIDEKGNITTEWTQIWMDKRCENICNLIKKEHDRSIQKYTYWIKHLMAKRELCFELGMNARKTILENWTWEKVTENERKIFREILNV